MRMSRTVLLVAPRTDLSQAGWVCVKQTGLCCRLWKWGFTFPQGGSTCALRLERRVPSTLLKPLGWTSILSSKIQWMPVTQLMCSACSSDTQIDRRAHTKDNQQRQLRLPQCLNCPWLCCSPALLQEWGCQARNLLHPAASAIKCQSWLWACKLQSPTLESWVSLNFNLAWLCSQEAPSTTGSPSPCRFCFLLKISKNQWFDTGSLKCHELKYIDELEMYCIYLTSFTFCKELHKFSKWNNFEPEGDFLLKNIKTVYLKL